MQQFDKVKYKAKALLESALAGKLEIKEKN